MNLEHSRFITKEGFACFACQRSFKKYRKSNNFHQNLPVYRKGTIMQKEKQTQQWMAENSPDYWFLDD
jgi:hypothetical protein